MDNNEQNKIWWEKQKNGGWKKLTDPLSQDPTIHSCFDNFIKKFYWQFRQKKGIPRGSHNPEINFRGFKEFIISQEELGHCSINWRKETRGNKITWYATIDIVINQIYLLNKLGMEKLITSDPNVRPGENVYFTKVYFKKLIKTIAHELAHAYQYTINLKKNGEMSSCKSSGKKDVNGNFLYPQLVAEHTQLTKEIRQMIAASTKYQEFKDWWTNNQRPAPEIIPEENEEEENNKRCKSCASKNTFGFDYCFKCRQEREEFEKLVALLKGSKDLSSLEKNYQNVKKNPLYSSSKNTLVENENNKKRLDNCYAKRAISLKLKNYNTNRPNDFPHFKGDLWIFILILWGIALLTIGLFIISRRKRNQKLKK